MEFGRKKVIDISDMLYEFDSPFTFGPFWLLSYSLSFGDVPVSSIFSRALCFYATMAGRRNAAYLWCLLRIICSHHNSLLPNSGLFYSLAAVLTGTKSSQLRKLASHASRHAGTPPNHMSGSLCLPGTLAPTHHESASLASSAS